MSGALLDSAINCVLDYFYSDTFDFQNPYFESHFLNTQTTRGISVIYSGNAQTVLAPCKCEGRAFSLHNQISGIYAHSP